MLQAQSEVIQMSALQDFPRIFTEAVSFVVRCDSQQEVDDYWSKLSAGGSEIQCGWLEDKFGLSWQIVPARSHQTSEGDAGRAPDGEAGHRRTRTCDLGDTLPSSACRRNTGRWASWRTTPRNSNLTTVARNRARFSSTPFKSACDAIMSEARRSAS